MFMFCNRITEQCNDAYNNIKVVVKDGLESKWFTTVLVILSFFLGLIEWESPLSNVGRFDTCIIHILMFFSIFFALFFFLLNIRNKWKSKRIIGTVTKWLATLFGFVFLIIFCGISIITTIAECFALSAKLNTIKDYSVEYMTSAYVSSMASFFCTLPIMKKIHPDFFMEMSIPSQGEITQLFVILFMLYILAFGLIMPKMVSVFNRNKHVENITTGRILYESQTVNYIFLLVMDGYIMISHNATDSISASFINASSLAILAIAIFDRTYSEKNTDIK